MAGDCLHHLEVFKEDQLGFFSKRDDHETNDVRWYAGTVYKCRHCLDLIFKSPGFQAVVVEMMNFSDLFENEREALDHAKPGDARA